MRVGFLPFALAIAVGCGDDSAPPPPDGGSPDGGNGDTVAPTVRDITPADGSGGIARDAEIVIRFSEPMATNAGTVRIDPGGPVRPASEGTWSDAGNVVTFEPTVPWPSGDVMVTVSDFTDLAGNVMAPVMVSFATVDDVPPEVMETTPAEGTTGLSARDTTIVIRFNERMRTGAGTLDVFGGSATLGAPEWSVDGTEVSFPVTDLEYEREYEARLRGFDDRAGNRFDPMPYLEDGAINFATGPDTDAPRVVRSDPTEGQVDVNPARMLAVLVTFDERMDTSVTEVTLSDGETDVSVDAEWTGADRILRVPVSGLLAFDTAYSIDLRGLRDRRGNTIDEATYLLDGRLDFTVGPDAFLPSVRSSTPSEGQADISYLETTEIRVTFSEAMDAAITSVPLTIGAEAAVDVSGAWSSDTEIVFDVDGLFVAGSTVTLDLRTMRDSRGNLLDPGDPYTGDGRLDFTTSMPIGEGCRDPLTIASATETMPGVYAWSLTSLQASERDGGTTYCDNSATSSNGTDLLVRFDKVSGAPGSGGRYLHIEVDAQSSATGSNPFDVAVMTGPSCNPTATPIECHSNAGFHSLDLDLPAGPVWIWIARTTVSTTSVAATLTITETDPPAREGDSCNNPFTTTSAIYTAPTTDNIHRFAIPQDAFRTMSISPYSYRGNDFSCDTAAGHGIDGVVRFEKPDDASVLRVTAQRTAGSDTLNVEVFDACDVDAAGTRSLGCVTALNTTAQSLIVDRPAGPVFVWVGDTIPTVSRSGGAWLYSSGLNVDIEVIPDVGTGEICSRARAATSGTNTVVGTSDQRFQAPSCFGATSSIEWYRVTATHEVMLVSSSAAGALGFMDPDSGAELACVADASALSLTRVLSIGEEVCLGVEMGRGISSFTVTGRTYTGLGRTEPVDLEILRPFNSSASGEESVTSDAWMGIHDTQLVMKHLSTAVMDVSRDGHERAVRRASEDGITSTMLGRSGVLVNGAVFSFTSSTTPASRVTRLWDGTSALWTPVTWDIGATYTSSIPQGAAVVGSDIVYATSAASPIFYRLSSLAPSTPTTLGTNTMLADIRGMTADNTFLYMTATVGGVRGVYRLPVASVSSAPTLIAMSSTFPTTTTQETAMEVDSLTAPRHLYVRNNSGDVEAILDPASASPFYLGVVIARGTSNDFAMTLDHDTGQLFLFETETLSTGRWLRYDP